MTFITSTRLLISVFVLLIISILANSCSSDNPFSSISNVRNTNFSFVEEFSFSGPISNQGKMNITGINGSIVIGLSDSNTFAVNVTKSVYSESENDAANYISQLRVNYEPGGETISISTEQPLENNGRILKVDYEIMVPKYLELNINQINGDVTLDSIYSESKIDLTNGKVELINHNASVDINLVNGNVVGEVYVPATIEGLCAIDVVNGTIDLGLPVLTSAEFSALILNGTIDISNNLIFQNQVSTENSFSGTLNAGDGTIELQVENGIIQVVGF